MGGFGGGGFGAGPYGGTQLPTPGSFPLSLVVNVSEYIASIAQQAPGFNQGLIIGSSTNIPSQPISSNSRLQQFTSVNAMLAYGFSLSSPEVLAAEIYFGQAIPPQYLWVGRQDLTAIASLIPHAGAAGTGYRVGDIVSIVQSGGSYGFAQVTVIGGGGAVTTLALIPSEQGTGYTVATGLATTGGTGTGLEVDITAIGETPLQAVAACRAASPTWYMCGVCGAVDADALAIAAYAQAATPQMVFVYNSSTAAIAANTAGNIALELKGASYNRVWGQYDTTQGGAYPNQIYFFAAIMGIAMGLNTGLAGSYFTMKFKTPTGVYIEPVTQSQLNNIEGANFNLFVSYSGGQYNFLEQGKVSNGQFFDEILFLDMLASQIQYNCMNVFTSAPSIPQTDGGEQLLINAVQQACLTMQSIGFIAPSGVWQGQTILGLAAGKALPQGFKVMAPPFSTQLIADTNARKMMPIYVALIEAGAGHSLTVGVFVQR